MTSAGGHGETPTQTQRLSEGGHLVEINVEGGVMLSVDQFGVAIHIFCLLVCFGFYDVTLVVT